MRDKATYFRSVTGRIIGDGMVEDDYSAESWPDWRSEAGEYGRSPFSPRRGGEDGPVIVYRAGEEPER